MAYTYDEDGSVTNSISQRKEKKKKDMQTPDNFGFGDMPADFRKRYKKMLDMK